MKLVMQSVRREGDRRVCSSVRHPPHLFATRGFLLTSPEEKGGRTGKNIYQNRRKLRKGKEIGKKKTGEK